MLTNFGRISRIHQTNTKTSRKVETGCCALEAEGKEAKESAKALKKQLEEQLKHYEQLEMNARRIVAEAKATELQDQAAELVSLELSKKNEARLQSSNYQTAKAVTHQAEMAGNIAAEASVAARVERQEHGHEVDALKGRTLSIDSTSIVREMEHASEISLAGKNFGGLSVEHEVSIFPEQSIHSALTRMYIDCLERILGRN